MGIKSNNKSKILNRIIPIINEYTYKTENN